MDVVTIWRPLPLVQVPFSQLRMSSIHGSITKHPRARPRLCWSPSGSLVFMISCDTCFTLPFYLWKTVFGLKHGCGISVMIWQWIWCSWPRVRARVSFAVCIHSCFSWGTVLWIFLGSHNFSFSEVPSRTKTAASILVFLSVLLFVTVMGSVKHISSRQQVLQTSFHRNDTYILKA